jgi:GH25 family lysozyme M1 (1,4-beta-N-acetylmuramidase)
MKILSQMFSQWHDIMIGKSNETVGRKGCLITCISMITDFIGHYINPGELAQTLDFTCNALLIWSSVSKAKLDFVYRYYSRDDAKIKKAFADPDQFVILQVNNNHWVWLIGIKGGYKVADPYYGDVIYISKRRYRITGFAILEKQEDLIETTPNEDNPDISGQGVDFLGLESGTKFLDLSHWNIIEDLSKVKSSGYKGIIHKCTQGVSYKDTKYIENKKRIKELNLAFGAYHFSNAGDPIQEAEWFLKNTGELQNGDIIVLDYETYAREDADDWCLRWMDYVQKKTGKKPILYTYHGMLNKYKFSKVAKANYKLWAARYGLQEQEPNEYYKPATGAFQKAWAWQYCSLGDVPGIDKRVDLNVIN